MNQRLRIVWLTLDEIRYVRTLVYGHAEATYGEPVANVDKLKRELTAAEKRPGLFKLEARDDVG